MKESKQDLILSLKVLWTVKDLEILEHKIQPQKEILLCVMVCNDLGEELPNAGMEKLSFRLWKNKGEKDTSFRMQMFLLPK